MFRILCSDSPYFEFFKNYLPGENRESAKHQKPTPKPTPMTQIQNSKHHDSTIVVPKYFDTCKPRFAKRHDATELVDLVIEY